MIFRAWVTVLLLFIPVTVLAKDGAERAAVETCGMIPLENIVAQPKLKVRVIKFDRNVEDSLSVVSVENQFSKPISEALILVEYLDQAERHILTSEYYARTESSVGRKLAPSKGLAHQALVSPVSPGHNASISYVSDIVAPRCPSTARVSKVAIRFLDGSVFMRTVRGWYTDPFIREAQQIDMTTFPAVVPTEVFTNVRLDEVGHLQVLKTAGMADEMKDWLQSQMEKWSVIPGEGDADERVGQIVTLLFRFFNSSGDAAAQPDRRLPAFHVPLIVVDVVLGGRNGKPVVFVAGSLATQHALSDK